MTNRVLVAGASGLVGHAAIRHFASLPGWDVVGLSRRTPEDLEGATLLSVDLLDADACRQAAGQMEGITHLVYAALQETPGLFQGWLDEENIERNGAMLRNLFEPLSQVATRLEHVSLLHGTKAYGLHHPSVGADGVHIPLREREPRREHPNFYFVQEDYLREKQRSAGWGLTVLRPTVIYGDAAGNNMNPLLAIAAYGALLRESGEPLHFPGQSNQPWLREAVSADLVARALGWAAIAPGARDATFNVTNGDVFVWQHVWPAIAETLGMQPGEHRPVALAKELPKRTAEWAALVERHGLRASRDIVEFVGYNSLVYADVMLGAVPATRIPTLNSTIAIRQAGFHDCIDTEDMFREMLQRLQQDGVIPPATG